MVRTLEEWKEFVKNRSKEDGIHGGPYLAIEEAQDILKDWEEQNKNIVDGVTYAKDFKRMENCYRRSKNS